MATQVTYWPTYTASLNVQNCLQHTSGRWGQSITKTERQCLIQINCSIKEDWQWNLISRIQSQFIPPQQGLCFHQKSFITNPLQWKKQAKENSNRPMPQIDITKECSDELWCKCFLTTCGRRGAVGRVNGNLHNQNENHLYWPSMCTHTCGHCSQFHCVVPSVYSLLWPDQPCTLIGRGRPTQITNKNLITNNDLWWKTPYLPLDRFRFGKSSYGFCTLSKVSVITDHCS